MPNFVSVAASSAELANGKNRILNHPDYLMLHERKLLLRNTSKMIQRTAKPMEHKNTYTGFPLKFKKWEIPRLSLTVFGIIPRPI